MTAVKANLHHISCYLAIDVAEIQGLPTLFAGFDFNFAKIFWLWVFVASAIVALSRLENTYCTTRDLLN